MRVIRFSIVFKLILSDHPMKCSSVFCVSNIYYVTQQSRQTFRKNMGLHILSVHSLQNVDVSRFLLIKDLLQFDSNKQPPLISEHQLFTFWVVTYGWFDRIINHKNENTNLRWCYTGWFTPMIFSTTQRCNIVATLLKMVATVLTMQSCVTLKTVTVDHSMYPCNFTFKPGGYVI